MKIKVLNKMHGLLSLTIRPKIFGLALLIVTLFFAGNARAASPGALDLSFGLRGTASFRFGSQFQESRAVAIQPDGKVVLAGYIINCVGATCDSNFLIVRFNTDGTLDTGFDTDGFAMADYSGQDESAFAMAIQADGKIVVAGGVWDATNAINILGFKVVRFLPDGTLDSTFGTGGKVYESFDDVGGTSANDAHPAGRQDSRRRNGRELHALRRTL
jgi:hypothetical protein